METKQKFYNKPWFMWLMLIFFAPVGIFLMYKNKKFTSKVRGVLTGVFAVWFLIIAIGANSNSSSTNTAQSNKENKTVVSNSKDESKKQDETQKIDETKKTEESKTAQAASAAVSGELKIHFINVGQADSILLQQGSQNMLIDAGNNGDSNTIKSYLDSQGVKELQYFVGTHAHEDHIGSADYILNSFKVGKVYFPKQQANTKTYTDFINAAKSKVGGLTAPNVGDTFKLGDATCTILAPNSASYEDANDYSIVIKVQFGDNKFLLTGDAQATSEMEMVKKGLDLKADLLKVGHHGSKTSTSANFLSAVAPKYAVVSVGKGNTYGHPAQGTMDRFKGAGVSIYRTDECGTIVATSNGKDISFNCKPGSYSGVASSTSTNTGSSNTSGSQTTNPTPKQTTPPPATGGTSENKGITVYVTPTGKKYHLAGCRTIKNSSTPISLQDAKNKGYDACGVCHPPQ